LYMKPSAALPRFVAGVRSAATIKRIGRGLRQ
jgi:hypothetical protein